MDSGRVEGTAQVDQDVSTLPHVELKFVEKRVELRVSGPMSKLEFPELRRAAVPRDAVSLELQTFRRVLVIWRRPGRSST